ncbi:MAG: translation initiation factor IF-6 [Candidatus Bathyarchaeia archaeon]
MPIGKMDVFGSPNIGVYCFVNEVFALVPVGLTEKKIKRFMEYLGVNAFPCEINASKLLGIFAASNSNGMVLPRVVTDYELKRIKSISDLNVYVLKTKKTALGNCILVNDYGAIVDPSFSGLTIKKLEDAFGVEVVKGSINGLSYVGSLGVATNKGAIVHPAIKENEKRLIEKVLKVPVETGTINQGVPFVKSGLLVNTRGAIVGSLTTGAELFLISQMFNV